MLPGKSSSSFRRCISSIGSHHVVLLISILISSYICYKISLELQAKTLHNDSIRTVICNLEACYTHHNYTNLIYSYQNYTISEIIHINAELCNQKNLLCYHIEGHLETLTRYKLNYDLMSYHHLLYIWLLGVLLFGYTTVNLCSSKK